VKFIDDFSGIHSPLNKKFMNKHVIKTVVYASCILAVLSFSQCSTDKKTDDAGKVSTSDTVVGSAETTTANYADTIDVEKARRMVSSFLRSSRHIDHGDGAPENRKEDTKWIWFDKATIDMIHTAMTKYENDGLRIYLAAYDDAATDKNYPYTTVILTTTLPSKLDNGREIHVDDLRTFGKTRMNMYIPHIPPVNQGGLCPPPNDSCRTLGALLLPPDPKK